MKQLKADKNTFDKYLSFGELTKPFLSVDEIKEKVYLDYHNKQREGKPCSIIQSLYCWINSNLRMTNDIEFNRKNKFNRSAKEIWESKTVTGCCDIALVFATMARQLNIPTTILETAEYDWAFEQDKRTVKGHFFCECFDAEKEKWVLVDPTLKRQTEDYDIDTLNLDYNVGSSNKYIPFKREVELDHRMNIKEYNDKIVSCFTLENEDDEVF